MVKVEWDLFKSPAGELAAVFIKSFEFEGQDHESHEIRMNLRAKIIATVSTKDGRQIFEAPHGQVFVFPAHFRGPSWGIFSMPGVWWSGNPALGRDAYDALFRGSEREREEAKLEAEERRQREAGRQFNFTWAQGAFRMDRGPVGATSGTFRTENMDEVFAAFQRAWAAYERPTPPRPSPPPPPRRPAPPPPAGPYAELGIAPGTDFATARAAYLKLARQHHPDAGGNPDRMKRVTAAWATVRMSFVQRV